MYVERLLDNGVYSRSGLSTEVHLRTVLSQQIQKVLASLVARLACAFCAQASTFHYSCATPLVPKYIYITDATLNYMVGVLKGYLDISTWTYCMCLQFNLHKCLPTPATLYWGGGPQSTHRVAMTDFWRTLHYIMMEKLALAGEGGGCTPIPFHSSIPSHTKLQCTLQLRGQINSLYFISTLYVLCGADTLPVIHLYAICTLWGGLKQAHNCPRILQDGDFQIVLLRKFFFCSR